jgi:hypothetical protein
MAARSKVSIGSSLLTTQWLSLRGMGAVDLQ